MFEPPEQSRPITQNMRDQPFMEVSSYCGKCPYMENALDAGFNNFDLAYLRNACTCCRNESKGIYKGDAIYGALQMKQQLEEQKQHLERLNQQLEERNLKLEKLEQQFRQKGNVGKKAVIPKRYGYAMKALKAEGKTLKEIAEMFKIHYNSVQQFFKKENATKTDSASQN